MKQVSIPGIIPGGKPQPARWLTIACGFAFQLALVAVLFLIGQPGAADMTLAPVSGDPSVCRVVSVALLSDAQFRGVTPGTLVRPMNTPDRDPGGPPNNRPGPGNTAGKIENCRVVSDGATVKIVGKEQEPPLIVSQPPAPSATTNMILGGFLALIFQVAGALILLRAQNRPTARVAYALFYVFSLLCFLFNGGPSSRSWAMLFFFVLTILTAGLSTTFVCLFPSPQQAQLRTAHPPIGARKLLRALPYLPLISSIIFSCCGITLFLTIPQGRFLIMSLGSIYCVLCLLVVLGTLVWGLRHLDQYERQFTRMIMASMTFLLLPIILFMGSFPFGLPLHDNLLRLVPIPLLVLPIIFDYALFRNQLIGTTSLASRRAMRVLLWILLACLFIYPLILLQRWMENAALLPETSRDYLYAGLLALILLFFPLAWNKVRNVGDHVFYRDFYQYNQSLRELSTALTRLQGLDQISAFVLPRLAQLLNTFDTILFIRAISQDEMHGQTGVYRENTQSWHMYRHTITSEGVSEERLRRIIDLALTHLPRHSHEPLLLDEILLLALYDGGQVSGFLCLGPKNNREPYSRQDRSFLATLTAQLSVLEVNNRYLLQARLDAQKVTALNRRVISAQEDERRHLALDLHDDVLQQAMLLMRHLSDAGTMSEVADAMPLARAVVQNLRRTCLALRPTLLDELGLAEALRWLARQTEQLGGKKLQVILDCANTTARSSDAVELALYRVAQEALTNVLKHANASKVILRLRTVTRYENNCLNTAFTLVIADNGRGAIQKQRVLNSLGMIGMHERIATIGGRLQVRNRPGTGFIVRATYSDRIQSHQARASTAIEPQARFSLTQ
jgi:signal transduction histidine kinase